MCQEQETCCSAVVGPRGKGQFQILYLQTPTKNPAYSAFKCCEYVCISLLTHEVKGSTLLSVFQCWSSAVTPVFTVFYSCLHTKIKNFTPSKTPVQSCTTISTDSASHFLQNITHSDLQNSTRIFTP